MTYEKATEYLEQCDGNASVFYPHLEERIMSCGYKDAELPYAAEFLFFESDYLRVLKDILERDIACRRVVDIGSHYGFQSEIFEGFDYLGIDNSPYFDIKKMFNHERPGVNYLNACFPEQVCAELVKDKIVISNMSLGFFGTVKGLSATDIAEALSQSQYLYIKTSDEFATECKRRFKRCIRLEDKKFKSIFPQYLMTNESLEV